MIFISCPMQRPRSLRRPRGQRRDAPGSPSEELAARTRFQQHRSCSGQSCCPLRISAFPPGSFPPTSPFPARAALLLEGWDLVSSRQVSRGVDAPHGRCSSDLAETDGFHQEPWESPEKPKPRSALSFTPPDLAGSNAGGLSPAPRRTGRACCPHQPKCLEEQLATIPKILFPPQVTTIRALSSRQFSQPGLPPKGIFVLWEAGAARGPLRATESGRR